MTGRVGYRGYIGSRAYFGSRAPAHVQNLVIRDYATRRGLAYLLSAVEYRMPGCFMMLEDVLCELGRIEGVVLYSLFMLPTDRDHRASVYRRVLDAGASLHAAVEDLVVADDAAARRIEETWRIHEALASAEGGA